MIEAGLCRLLRHDPAPGAWNMAVDEMLLERTALVVPPLGGIPSSTSNGIPPTMGTSRPGGTTSACLRLYAWSKPTISLGYFQTYTDRQNHPASLACAAVRRLTGGGAILHDAEVTYSVVLPGNHPLAARRDELYQAVHGCLIEALSRLGIAARLCDAGDKIEAAREPFLCFQRRSPGDVLVGPTKICGSAQRRRNGAVLQHGSLLWQASPAAPELPGVADVASHPIEVESVVDLWLSGLSRRLDFGWMPAELDEKELRQAETIMKTRYADDDWTKNRGRSADRSQESV